MSKGVEQKYNPILWNEHSYCRTILTEELASLSLDDEIISGGVRGKCVFTVE